MKLKYLILNACLWILVASCLRDEAPNAEADILTCTVLDDILTADPIIENSRITLMVNPYLDENAFKNLTLYFMLTPGATIDPPSGTARDFNTPQKYVVTSEDGKWKKEYTVSIADVWLESEYHFETFEMDQNNRYYEFYEMPSGSTTPQRIWASGNEGFALLNASQPPENYPTAPTVDGYEGYAAKLITRSTGPLGIISRKPIAAGNLFIGTFDARSALLNPLQATHFGFPFTYIPTSLTGYYKYKAGVSFTNSNNTVLPDRKDMFDIYAIMYETDDQVSTLNGANALTSPNLIATALFNPDDKKETDEWTYFSLPFVYLPGKAIDPDKLADSKYKISVIFTSSKDGGAFEGAVGSTLTVDEVTLVHFDRKYLE